MLRKRAKPSRSGGITNQQQHEIAFDIGGATAAISAPKLFVVSSSGEASPERRQPEPALMSPTSTLQTASATTPAAAGTAVPFSRRRGPRDATPVGLGLVVGSLNDDGDGEVAAAPGDVVASSVLTGQKLHVQTGYYYAPCSPSFGVKSGGGGGGDLASSPRHRWCVSPAATIEMTPESEDYTCVIARGANPRTTHIFDNRVVETSSGGYFFPAAAKLWSPRCSASGDDFLRYCHGCSKDLGLGKDIFMYRGEKAFCSRECRYHEMLFDEGIEEY